MTVIDFRVRPPFMGFLNTLMYSQPDRRDRFTRQLGFEPSPAAIAKSCDLLINEMDDAGIDIGVVVGRNSGLLGSVENSDVAQCVAAYPGRFIGVASITLTDRKAAIAEIDATMSSGFKAINIEPGAQIRADGHRRPAALPNLRSLRRQVGADHHSRGRQCRAGSRFNHSGCN